MRQNEIKELDDKLQGIFDVAVSLIEMVVSVLEMIERERNKKVMRIAGDSD